MTADERFDVAVVGGGPAGSTMATLLAMAGWQVALIEGQHHPRFHIGELLLPHTTPILARLGVLERMGAVGVEKRGADFTAPDGARRDVDFTRALNFRTDAIPAFQVKRAAFDQLLFANAAAHGAATFEGWTVRSVDLAAAEGVRIGLRSTAGEERGIGARELVDASGRDGLLARHLELRLPCRRHASAAIYAHFEGALFQAPPLDGNISIYWFEHGWFWMIPLQQGVMSVGAVAHLPYLKSRAVPLERFFEETVGHCPAVAARLQDAVRIGPVHAASNYSYDARQLYGRNWSLVGDALAFVDPVFSSGVHFAMGGAEILADALDARLRGAADAERRMAMAERRIRQALATMSWLIHRFNDASIRRLFLNPRDILGVERALLAILAGDVFGRTDLGWRYALFKLFYRVDRLLLRAARIVPAERRQHRLTGDASPST